IEQLYRNEPEAIQSLLDNLLPLSTEGVNAAYDSLSGVQHTHTQAIVGNLYRRFQSLLSDRLASGYITSASHDLSLSLSDERWARQLGFGLRSRSLLEQGRSVERGLWLRSFGGVGDIDATANASGADYTSAGVAVGVDAQLNNGVIVGVAAGYAHTDADTFGGSLDIDSYQVAGYAGWAHNDSYLNGSLGVGVHRSDASRRVVVGGFTGDAEADYDTLGMTAALEAGHHLYMNNAIRLTPFVGVAYTHLDRSDFTESGAGSANLTVGQESQELLRSKVGLRFEKTFATPGGVRITPMIETAYVREHLDSQNVISAGFANASDATFRIAGPDLDRNRIQLGASLGVWFSERSSLGIGYQAEFADSDDWHSLAATFRMRW
ncbi:MAG TPA: autotransporter outer membrane beta-barrel domain-containing protein, partial [Modicisalibacter sp.]|nr:autotransporter outer membrane beta-barrel domain-containing protein [Modicisalibacter sp.]